MYYLYWFILILVIAIVCFLNSLGFGKALMEKYENSSIQTYGKCIQYIDRYTNGYILGRKNLRGYTQCVMGGENDCKVYPSKDQCIQDRDNAELLYFSNCNVQNDQKCKKLVTNIWQCHDSGDDRIDKYIAVRLNESALPECLGTDVNYCSRFNSLDTCNKSLDNIFSSTGFRTCDDCHDLQSKLMNTLVNNNTQKGLKYFVYDGYYNSDPNWFNNRKPIKIDYTTDINGTVNSLAPGQSIQFFGLFKALATDYYKFYVSSKNPAYFWFGESVFSDVITCPVTNQSCIDSTNSNNLGITQKLTANNVYDILIQCGRPNDAGTSDFNFQYQIGNQLFNNFDDVFYYVFNGI